MPYIKNHNKRRFGGGLKIGLAGGVLISMLIASKPRAVYYWDEFHDIHACDNNIAVFCDNVTPRSPEMIKCLYENYESLSVSCWRDIAYFATKYPNSDWKIFKDKNPSILER